MELGFLGNLGGSVAIDGQDDVAIGSTQPPELSANAVEEHVSSTATILFWVALGYLAVFVFSVVTF